MKPLRMPVFATLMLLAALGIANGQSWQPLTHQPSFPAGAALLLTDGTVMVHHEDANDGFSEWYKLTPDINGSYVNGTWTQVASLASNYGPLFFASAVLPDGRLIVEGGEQNFRQLCLDQHGRNLRPAGQCVDADEPAERVEQHWRRLERRPDQRDLHAGQLLHVHSRPCSMLPP